MSDYRPISCRAYAQLEQAILRGTRLRAAWRSHPTRNHLAQLEPLDLQARSGEEFLIAQDEEGRRLRIRLDRIRRFEGI
jgi:transcriptional antiterminator Rof (Rho-off)